MRFVRILQSDADQPGGAVSVHMLGDDNKRYHFEFAAACVPLLVTALATESRKLDTTGADQQFLVAKGITVAVSDRGAPMLILRLENEVELGLAFEGGHLGELIRELQALSVAIAPGKTH